MLRHSVFALLWVIPTWLMHLSGVCSQNSSIQAELETYTLKLSKREHFLIDLAYFSQQINKDYRILTYTHLNPGFNSTDDPTVNNIRWNRFLAYSDNFTNKDCATNVSTLFTGNVTWRNSAIYSRNVYGKNSSMYVVTTYIALWGQLVGVTPPTMGYNNRVETLAVTFSSNSTPVVKQFPVIEYPAYHANLTVYRTPKMDHCYSGVYIANLKDTFVVCRQINFDNNTELLYVQRSSSETMFTFHVNQGEIANKDQIKMKYFHIGGTSYELWIYIAHFSKKLWVVTLDKSKFHNLQALSLVYCPASMDFIARHLVLLTLNSKCNDQVNDRRIFWATKHPGDPVKISDPNLLVDGTFLNWYSSNEDTELIIETYKETRVAKAMGDPHALLISSFSYDVVSGKIYLTKSVIIMAYYSPLGLVDLKSINGFHARESSRYLLSFVVTLYSYVQQTKLYTPIARGNLGMWFMTDPYTGFIPTYWSNSSFNIFSQWPIVRDHRDSTYFLLGYETNLVWNGTNHNCSMYRQDIGYEHLQIKNILDNTRFFKYLNLTFMDTVLNKNLFRFNIEFLEDKEMLPHQDKIWRNSNDSFYQEAVQDGEKYVALKMLVRGSMTVPFLSSQYPLNLDYTKADEKIIKEIESKAFFSIQAFPFSALSDDLVGSELEDCVGLLYSSPQFTFEKTFFLIKKLGFSQTFVYEYMPVNGSLVKKNFLPVSSRITWAYPLKKNLYMMATVDGGLFTFSSDKEVLVDIPYVGTSCNSVAMAYHLGIKPAIVCLNLNFELAYYYIDELLSKSMIYSRLDLESPQLLSYLQHSNTSSCVVKTSDEFEGKVFVYCPATSKDQAAVGIFYLEVEDNLQVIFVESVNLMGLLPDETRIKVLRVNSFDVVGDNLVVTFKGSLGSGDCVGVWRYEREGYFKLMKLTELPIEWNFNSRSSFLFRRHFISKSFYNPPAGLLMELVSQQTGDRNLVVIDPASPELETFQTTILPRASKGSSFTPFTMVGFTETNQRLFYTGIVHWQQSSSIISSVVDYVPRVQIVYPGLPKVTAPSDTGLAYKEVFSPDATVKNPKYTVEFENLIALQRSQSKPISKTFQLIRPTANLSMWSTALPDIRLEYEDKLSNFTNIQDTEIKIFSKPFRQLFNLSAIAWVSSAESIYDEVTGTIAISKPLELVSTINTGQNLRGILEYQEICLQYSKPNETKRCIRWGTALFFANSVLLKYDNQVTSWNSKNIVAYNFTNDKCTKFWVINNNLASLCTFDLIRKLALFNPTTLEVTYTSSASTFNFDPERTTYRTASVQGLNFVMLSVGVLDDFNRRGVGRSLLYFYSGSVLETTKLYPSTYFRELLLTDVQQADQCIDAHYNISSGNFFVTVNSVAVGNYKQFRFVSRVTVELWDTNRTDQSASVLKSNFRTDRPVERSMRFSTPDYSRVKEEIFAHVQITPLLFDSKEQFMSAQNFEDDYSSTLVHFPNYHSYVLRFRGQIHPCNSSMYKLWNPFEGMMNEHVLHPTACHFWACAAVYQKGTVAFVSLYDLNFEEMRAANQSNFQEIFNQANFTVNCSATPDSQVFDLTTIPEKYTRYPMQILNLSKVERVQFDTSVKPYIYTKDNLNQTFAEDQTDHTLRLQVFFTDGKISLFRVSRSFGVSLRSPSISSEFLRVEVLQPRGQKTQYSVWLPSYLMRKNRVIPVCIYLAAIILATGFTALVYKLYLAKVSFGFERVLARPKEGVFRPGVSGTRLQTPTLETTPTQDTRLMVEAT